MKLARVKDATRALVILVTLSLLTAVAIDVNHHVAHASGGHLLAQPSASLSVTTAQHPRPDAVLEASAETRPDNGVILDCSSGNCCVFACHAFLDHAVAGIALPVLGSLQVRPDNDAPANMRAGSIHKPPIIL